MVQYLFFPAEHFGVIYGLAGLWFLPLQAINIPMHAYNIKQESFALMSYIMGGFWKVHYLTIFMEALVHVPFLTKIFLKMRRNSCLIYIIPIIIGLRIGNFNRAKQTKTTF